jgi:hypothetical protein
VTLENSRQKRARGLRIVHDQGSLGRHQYSLQGNGGTHQRIYGKFSVNARGLCTSGTTTRNFFSTGIRVAPEKRKFFRHSARRTRRLRGLFDRHESRDVDKVMRSLRLLDLESHRKRAPVRRLSARTFQPVDAVPAEARRIYVSRRDKNFDTLTRPSNYTVRDERDGAKSFVIQRTNGRFSRDRPRNLSNHEPILEASMISA